MRIPWRGIAVELLAALPGGIFGAPDTARATITEYPVAGLRYGTAAGPDGAMWFTEHSQWMLSTSNLAAVFGALNSA
jgi:hypothetical protein